jgi:hypothetical protein
VVVHSFQGRDRARRTRHRERCRGTPIPVLADAVSNAFGIAGFAALGVHLLRMGNTRWLAGAIQEGTSVPSPVPAIS